MRPRNEPTCLSLGLNEIYERNSAVPATPGKVTVGTKTAGDSLVVGAVMNSAAVGNGADGSSGLMATLDGGRRAQGGLGRTSQGGGGIGGIERALSRLRELCEPSEEHVGGLDRWEACSPSRRSRAAMAPRSVQRSASATIRSLSSFENRRRCRRSFSGAGVTSMVGMVVGGLGIGVASSLRPRYRSFQWPRGSCFIDTEGIRPSRSPTWCCCSWATRSFADFTDRSSFSCRLQPPKEAPASRGFR